YRPGVAARLGFDYPTVKARNPRIVYCSISAFGNSSPDRERPAHDLALEAASGVLSMTVGNDGEPVIPGIPIADHLSALQGLAAILMALLRRETSGLGDYVDIAMHDAMLAACVNIVGPTFAQGRQPVPRHERATGGSAFYQIYQTSDGRHVVLAGQERKFIETLLRALARPDLIDLCLKGPGPHQQPVIDFLQATFRQRTQAEIVAFLSKLDVCFAPVNTLPEAFANRNAAARGMALADALGRRHIAPAIRFAHEPPAVSLTEPRLGEHTDEILGPLRRSASDAA